MPQALRTTRVPVYVSDTVVQYLKDADWVENPGPLFGRLLGETIAARTGRVVLDPSQYSHDPGTRLTGQLLRFGLDPTGWRWSWSTTRRSRAARPAASRPTASRRGCRSPRRDPAAVAPALNQAANQVADQVAAWLGASLGRRHRLEPPDARSSRRRCSGAREPGVEPSRCSQKAPSEAAHHVVAMLEHRLQRAVARPARAGTAGPSAPAPVSWCQKVPIAAARPAAARQPAPSGLNATA